MCIRDSFLDSTNEGFLPLEGTQVKVRLDGKVETVDVAGETDLSADAVAVIRTVLKEDVYKRQDFCSGTVPEQLY